MILYFLNFFESQTLKNLSQKSKDQTSKDLGFRSIYNTHLGKCIFIIHFSIISSNEVVKENEEAKDTDRAIMENESVEDDVKHMQKVSIVIGCLLVISYLVVIWNAMEILCRLWLIHPPNTALKYPVANLCTKLNFYFFSS